jgi:hypothetical protein
MGILAIKRKLNHALMFAAVKTFTSAEDWKWIGPHGVRLFQGKSTFWTRCQYWAIHTIACAVQFTFHSWVVILGGIFRSRDARGICTLPVMLLIAEGTSVFPKSVLFSLFLGTKWNACVAHYAGNLAWAAWLCRMAFTVASTLAWIACFTMDGPARYSFHDESPTIHKVLHASVIRNSTLKLPADTMSVCVCGGYCKRWRADESTDTPS